MTQYKSFTYYHSDISGIADNLRRLANRREHPRYVVKDGSSVIVSYGEGKEQNVQLIDICDGGMSFIHEGLPSDLPTPGTLKLFEKSEIKFNTVADVSVSHNVQSLKQCWRRSVKFENYELMGLFEKLDLNDFIDTTKLCEA